MLRPESARSVEEATAAAHFELGQHLHRLFHTVDTVDHFWAPYRLQPDNWPYKRQAWSLVDPSQIALELYGSNWLTDVRKIGAKNRYPPHEMCEGQLIR